MQTVTDLKTGTAVAALRQTALNAALSLRDCSLRRDRPPAERLACRTLMRGEALRWRDPDRTLFGL
ncbi:MAG TPA: hypothetical protein VHE61_17910 [Opitutaceae bacterium]|nr:hypothetical protein [Opitutaceae bacterium]